MTKNYPKYTNLQEKAIKPSKMKKLKTKLKPPQHINKDIHHHETIDEVDEGVRNHHEI